MNWVLKRKKKKHWMKTDKEAYLTIARGAVVCFESRDTDNVTQLRLYKWFLPKDEGVSVDTGKKYWL